MQPSIVRSNVSLDSVQDDFTRRYNISEDASNFAEGTGVLPGETTEPNWWQRAKKKPEPGAAKPVIRRSHKR